MGLISLHGQVLFTVEEALAYLQDRGTEVDDNDLLRQHMNGITATMLQETGRDVLKWVDDDEITEHKNGNGMSTIWVKNAPIRKITSITLNTDSSDQTTVTVPTEPAIYTSEVSFNPVAGSIKLMTRVWPEGRLCTIVYEAGYYDATSGPDPEFLGLKMIGLNALARAWRRWKDKQHGVRSKSNKETTITYTSDDFTKDEITDLRRYRRNLFA